MATKKKATTAKNESAKKVKTAEPKPKREKKPNDANRVFAIRVSDAELAAIHKASGPRNASRLARAVMAAFAADDTKAFEAVVKEAREVR